MTGAVAWTEGFDMYNGANAGTGLPVRWSFANYNGSTTAAGRFGGQSLQLVGTAGGPGTIGTPGPQDPTARAVFDGSGTATALAVGFAFMLTSSRQDALLDIQTTGGAQQFALGVSATGQLILCNAAGATVFTGAAGLVTTGTWYYVEIEATLNASTGTLHLYLGGTDVSGALTGLNTGGGAGLIQFRLFGGGNVTQYRDDVYVFAGAATRRGESRIETLRPASDNTAAWTPNSGSNNFSRVNEAVVDGDTSYVQTATIGARDLYTIGGLSSTPANIWAVNVVSFAEKTDATARSVYNSIKSGLTSDDGTANPLLSSYSRFDAIRNTDPNTSAAWTASGVNNLLIGPKAA